VPCDAYQLFQIPSTDLHVPLVLVQALSELLGIDLTASLSPAVLRSLISLRSNSVLLRLLSCWSGRSSEETGDCVANGRSDCYASAIVSLSVVGRSWELTLRCWRCFPACYHQRSFAVVELEEQRLKGLGVLLVEGRRRWLLVGSVGVQLVFEEQLDGKGHVHHRI